jgi:hypothetical protein
MADIAHIEILSLAEVFGNEVAFTNWLSQNIEKLEEGLGFGMEAQGTETAVGTFRADVVAKADNGDMVVIEAQFNKTDHPHLGQVLTYAGGIEAGIIIWIAERFREEHRAGLDWLINHSELKIFGVEAKAIRIDEGRPAVDFVVVSSPNDWSRTARTVIDRGNFTDTEMLRFEYWSALNQLIEEQGSNLTRYKPDRNSWNGGTVGRKDVGLNYSISSRDNWVQVEIYLSGKQAKEQFDWLYERRDDLLNELDDLTWERLDEKIASRIRCRLDNADLANKEDWALQHQWIIDNRLAFDSVFRPIITQDEFPT